MKASEISPKKLVVFDIDDTLVHTQTKVHVVKDGEVVDSLNSHDFTHYRLKPGEEFDFSGFRNAREFFEKSKPIIPMMNQLKRDIATGNKVVMVTARADFDDKELFLDTFRKFGIDMSKVHVYRAGNSKEGSTEERKKAIIKRLLDSGNFTKAIMYDDAKPNLHTFMELKRDHPRTKFYAWHVSLEGEASEYMREGIEKNFGYSITLADRFATPVIRRNKQGELRISTLDGNNGEFLVLHDNGKYMELSPENKEYLRQKFGLKENFADGKKKGKSRPGRVKRAGASCKGSVTDLRKRAKNSSGEKQKMLHWCANMKSGRNK